MPRLPLRPTTAARAAAACLGAAAALLWFSACSRSPPAAPPPKHGYVGAAACAECHEERWETFRLTGHHNTSSLPSEETIKGCFAPPSNRMPTSNPGLAFEMERRGESFVQTARERGPGNTMNVRSERIDVVVGSGKLGQSYLWWQGAELFQLPVSYFTAADAWMNSPGDIFIDGTARYDRAIAPRCVECHATWLAPAAAGPKNAYDRDDIVLGVSCERCHGPGADHVAWHRANPGSAEGRRIVKPAELPRERSLDLCGQCHGGVGKPVRPSFTYRPGLKLDEFVDQRAAGAAAPSLHSANQLRRLQQSRCYIESGTLTCVTCHDPHVVERGDDAPFSKRCAKCHTSGTCRGCAKAGHPAGADCIPCHMVREEVQGTGLQTAGGTAHPTMADHKIRIDRAASDRWLAEQRLAEQRSK